MKSLLLIVWTVLACSLQAAIEVVSPFNGAKLPCVPSATKRVLDLPTYEQRLDYLKSNFGSIEKEIRDSDWRKPEPLVLVWRVTEGEKGPWRVQIAKSEDFSDARTWYFPAQKEFSSVITCTVESANLEIGTKYRWRVAMRRRCGKDKCSVKCTCEEHKQVVASAPATFTTEDRAPRWIGIEGRVGNFRDLGGWRTSDGRRVRQGMIYRGEGLNDNSMTGETRGRNRLTVADVEYLTGALGIRTDLDLRMPGELGDLASSPLGRDIRFINHSSGFYRSLFTADGKKAMADNFRVFCNRANYPVYVHCIGGADRTGSLAYVLNGVLGVSRDDLERDWESTFYPKALPEMRPGFTGHDYWCGKWHLDEGFARYGDERTTWNDRIVLFLKDCGITDAEIETFRSIMLAPFTARYTPEVTSRSQHRGAMVSQYSVSEQDLIDLKGWGATLIRCQMYPVGEQWKGKTGTPEGFAAWLNWKLGIVKDELLPMARKHGLEVVVDLHVPPGGRGGSGMKMLDDPVWADFFVACWTNIVTTLKGEKSVYAYDLINEPTQFGKPKVCDFLEIQRRAAKAIRTIDPVTPVVVSCNADGAWCAPSAFKTLKPIDELNVLYQFHMYEPFPYTHQKVLPQFKDTVAVYPDAAKGWDRDGLRKILEPVRAFEAKYGARIFVGEFSTAAYAKGGAEWISDVTSLLNEYNWDWCYHAFRESPVWSVEHVVTSGDSHATAQYARSPDNPRKRALLKGLAGHAPYPLIVKRLSGNTLSKPDFFKAACAVHAKYRGAFDEFWSADGKPLCTLSACRKDLRAFAAFRPDIEAAGMKLSYQQGLTLGHDYEYVGKPGTVAAAGVYGADEAEPFPNDAWMVRPNGEVAKGRCLCPRSPAVLDYERRFVQTVLEELRPSTFWLDDDLRLGVGKDGCFCPRCLAAFNAQEKTDFTREALVKRIFGGDEIDPIRRAWVKFNEESLAAYGRAAREGADAVQPDCRLALQTVSADSLLNGRDYGPILRALSDNGRVSAGIRPGHGCYMEEKPMDFLQKALWCTREAERCRRLGAVCGTVCYEEETYTRKVLHKSPNAIVTECALALASGCDTLSLYWADGEESERIADYERFVKAIARARPYFERLSASTRRTSLGGVARFVGSNAAAQKGLSLGDPADLAFARCGIPVTVAEATASNKVWFVTEKSRAAMTDADAAELTRSGFLDLPAKPYPTVAERTAWLDEIDRLTDGRFPVRVDLPHALRVLPRVDAVGRTDSVTILNLSIGAAEDFTVRIRNPRSHHATLVSPREEKRLTAAYAVDQDELVVTIPTLDGWCRLRK